MKYLISYTLYFTIVTHLIWYDTLNFNYGEHYETDFYLIFFNIVFDIFGL